MTALPGKKCGRCNAPVPPDALWGLCSKCLYDEAVKVPVTEGVFNAGDRRFGDYELGEVVGRGGMGVVYQATQVSLRRPVALKMILNSEAASPMMLRRFTLEAEAAAKLDHPNIVPIYEVGERDGQPFLSMKFIAGENLRAKIASGELCLTPKSGETSRNDLRERFIAVVQLLARIARAVHHAHENGVLHRDLKPANILVDGDGQPHLTDFGLAKLIGPDANEAQGVQLTKSGLVLGTPSYMSPEQAAGEVLTPTSDIYSLGAILYEMLTGRPPFEAGSVLETLRLVSEQEPKSPSTRNRRIDKDLDTICLKCLEKNPNARYPTAEALAEDLERWLRHETIRARPASLALRTRRWVARNRVGAVLIVTLFVGLALALGLLKLASIRQGMLDLRRANSVQSFSRRVDAMWKDRKEKSVFISSSDLAELADLPPRRTEPGATHLTLGISISHDPNEQAAQFAPFLNALERRMEKILHRSIFIDLRLYKSQADAINDAAEQKLDWQRIGAVSYVLAKQTIAGLEPIVRERIQKEAVLFASKDSGITTMTQIAGRRVVFAQSNAPATFWAKVHLAHERIYATNLQAYFHLSGTRPVQENPARPQGSEDRDSANQAYKQGIQELFLGRADVSAAPRRFFELFRYRRHGLVQLLAYEVTPDVYVARPGLEPEVVAALRESLVSFQSPAEKELLGKFSQTVRLEGFDAAADSNFTDIRTALTNEVAEFERNAQPSPLMPWPAPKKP